MIFSADDGGATALEKLIQDVQIDLALLFVEEGQGVLTLHQLLYEAVRLKQLQFVNALLCRDENVIKLASERRDGRDAPFLVAVYQEHDDMVDLLLRTGQIDLRSRHKDGNTPLFVAVQQKSPSIVKLLLDTGRIGLTQWNLDERELSAKSLPDEHQDMDEAVWGSSTAKYESRATENWLWAIEHERLRMMKLLLDESMANTNLMVEGQTPLMWAMQRGKESVFKILLSSLRVDLHFIDGLGRTALSLALDYSKDRMVLLLLSAKGFSIHRESNDTSRNLFWWAIGRGNLDVINMLHESGKYGVNTRDGSGRTPLIYAAETCAEEAMSVLLITGRANLQVVDNRGDIALSIAMRRG
ncbi:hypothetical protein FAGAP_4112 [Fusarium agapanthi]|uniref:Ankyrin n=1 Tax=Fusarium agapanthi TaxID=1803897 RepID=A0A9P5BD37_9HYPO|nr:hypothetical protein FAGAP_4112 [Fusarium agapanthi]